MARWCIMFHAPSRPFFLGVLTRPMSHGSTLHQDIERVLLEKVRQLFPPSLMTSGYTSSWMNTQYSL